MARINAILLLILFLLNSIGGITLLLIQRHERHEYIESLIRSDSYRHHLTAIRFSESEFDQINWVEKDREFRHQGEMYDVVRTETLYDGSIIFHCIHDHEETQLYADLESNLGTSPVGHHSDRTIVLKIFKFLSTLSIPNSSETTLDFYEGLRSELPYLASAGCYSPQILTEPPELSQFIF